MVLVKFELGKTNSFKDHVVAFQIFLNPFFRSGNHVIFLQHAEFEISVVLEKVLNDLLLIFAKSVRNVVRILAFAFEFALFDKLFDDLLRITV